MLNYTNLNTVNFDIVVHTSRIASVVMETRKIYQWLVYLKFIVGYSIAQINIYCAIQVCAKSNYELIPISNAEVICYDTVSNNQLGSGSTASDGCVTVLTCGDMG